MTEQEHISDLVETLRFHRTTQPEKEIPAVVAELCGVMERVRVSESWRGDWMGNPV